MKKYVIISINSYLSHYAGLPAYCWKRMVVSFISTIASGLGFYISLYFVLELHMNPMLAGILVSCFGVGTIIGGYISGRLSDKYSPSRLSSVSLFMESICFFILPFVTSSKPLIFLMLAMGTAAYGFLTANKLDILNYCADKEAEKLKVINIITTVSNLAIGLSALTISLFAHEGFHRLFYLAGMLLFCVALYLLWGKESVKITKFSPLIAAQKSVPVHVIPLKNSRQKNTLFWIILTCLFVTGLIVSQTRSTYPIYLNDSFPEAGLKSIGGLLALNPLIIVLFQTPLVNRFNQVNKIFMIGFGSLLLGFGMLVLTFSHDFIWAILACVIYTSGEMFFFSMTQLVCYQMGEKHKKGKRLGIYQTIYALSVVTGPTAGGVIYHHLSGNVVWYLSGVIGLSCFLVCNHYKKYYLAF